MDFGWLVFLSLVVCHTHSSVVDSGPSLDITFCIMKQASDDLTICLPPFLGKQTKTSVTAILSLFPDI